MTKFDSLFKQILKEENTTAREPRPYEPMKGKSYAVEVYVGNDNEYKQEVFEQIKKALMSAEDAENITKPYAQSTIPPNWAPATEVVRNKDTIRNGLSMLKFTVAFPAPKKMFEDRFNESIILEVIRALGFVELYSVNPIGFY